MKRFMKRVVLCSLGAMVVQCTALASLAQAIPTPVHSYAFSGDLADSGTGNQAIVSEGGTLGASLYTFDPQSPPGDNNQGLTLESPAISDPGTYSIEMYLKYDTVRSISDDHWIKLIDFKDASAALGVYYEDMPFSTRFDPVPAEPGIESLVKIAYTNPNPGPPGVAQSTGPVMTPGEWNHLVATRDASDEFVFYVDGQEVFSFLDILDDAVFTGPNAIMRFLQNDSVDDSFQYYNVAKGEIDFLNVYDTALSPGDVAALAAAVPEPSSIALLAGVSLLVVSRSGRRKAL